MACPTIELGKTPRARSALSTVLYTLTSPCPSILPDLSLYLDFSTLPLHEQAASLRGISPMISNPQNCGKRSILNFFRIVSEFWKSCKSIEQEVEFHLTFIESGISMSRNRVRVSKKLPNLL
jgi:hypothetical protein